MSRWRYNVGASVGSSLEHFDLFDVRSSLYTCWKGGSCFERSFPIRVDGMGSSHPVCDDSIYLLNSPMHYLWPFQCSNVSLDLIADILTAPSGVLTLRRRNLT